MLSVLSSGTLHLSEELNYAKQEANRLRSSNAELLRAFQRRRNATVRHLEAVWRVLGARHDAALKQTAFLALASSRSHCQFWRRSGSAAVAGGQSQGGQGGQSGQGGRRSAWLWLWRRKLFSVWRRAAHLERRAELERRCGEQLGTLRQETGSAHARMAEVHRRSQDLEALLAAERRRSAELEGVLAKATQQVAELQRTLKACYVQQFQEAQCREELEGHCSALIGDMQRLRLQHELLGQEAARRRGELARAEAQGAERDQRILEASGEITLAEEVIVDIASAKCVGLRRFFEKYDLPRVLVALFRKMLELRAQLRRASVAAAEAGGNAGTCTGSPSRSLAEGSPTSRSPLATGLAWAGLSALEAEVRQLSSHGDAVSRHALQAYLEGLKLEAPGMVAQVLLALMGLQLGDGGCDTARFLKLLASPPPWEQLDFATALWGAAGEPAAAVVEKYRRLARSPQPQTLQTLQNRPRVGRPKSQEAPGARGTGPRPARPVPGSRRAWETPMR